MNLSLKESSSSDYVYISDEFRFPKGEWYIYAFIHLPANYIQWPTEGTTLIAFEQQKVDLSVGTINWFSDYYRLMGTLVREKTTIVGSGSSGNPETVRLKVGHLLSKIIMPTEVPKTGGNLKGTFTGAQAGGRINWNVACEPKQIYLVGQWSNGFMQDGSQGLSPHYYTYDPYTDFQQPLYEYPKTGAIPWYTVENTNQVPTNKNTSCFCLQYKYTAVPEEVHKADHTTGGAVGGTFWVAEFKDGTKLIYEVSPTTPHPALGTPVQIKMYDSGLCYYRVPIADNSQLTPSLRYSVIRNYLYELKVNSISGFGDSTIDDWEDPEVPWLIDPDIDITIHMQDWIPYEIPVDLD
ncbi:MAG: fimbria major subunit [Tannerellaceae bacterium]|nr:fimbria major subunit [Tannerellaceae bacterium]